MLLLSCLSWSVGTELEHRNARVFVFVFFFVKMFKYGAAIFLETICIDKNDFRP